MTGSMFAPSTPDMRLTNNGSISLLRLSSPLMVLSRQKNSATSLFPLSEKESYQRHLLTGGQRSNWHAIEN